MLSATLLVLTFSIPARRRHPDVGERQRDQGAGALKALIAAAAVATRSPMAATASLAPAFEAAIEAHRHAVSRICTTRVTPEVVRLYQPAVAAVQAARSGSRPPRNLAGLRPPEIAYTDSFQAR